MIGVPHASSKRVRYVHLKDVRAHILDQVKEEQSPIRPSRCSGCIYSPGRRLYWF